MAATLFCLGSTLSAESRLPGIQTATLDAALKGRLLLEELNCVACHAAPTGADLKSKQAPRLSDVAQRIHPTFLEKYIGAPHTTKPGSTMPDLLAKLPEAERATAAKELTHFLLSLKASTFAPQAPDAVAAAQGEKLFHARGCAACHSPRDAQGRETLAAKSVPLGALEDKYSLRTLVEFLRQPHLSRPSGRMPDLKLPARELECVAHYLLRDTRVPGHLNYTMYRGQVWEGIGHEAVEPERAGQTADFALSNFDRVHHHMALRFEGWINLKADGDYQFFLKANGATLTINGKEVAALAPKDRRGVQAIEGKAALRAGMQQIRLDYYHTGREPSLSFEVAGPNFPRQAIASALLSVSEKPIPAFSRPIVDAQLATQGRKKFSQLGCVSCHNDVGAPASAPAVALTMADVTHGCLDPQSTSGARFNLSAEQVTWIRAALKQGVMTVLTPEQTLHTELTRFNCIACHDRRGLGGIAPERNALFTSTAPALGDQGRLPPPLSDVGAKLTTAGLEGALLQGQRPRPYIETVMPQFGETNMRPLVALFSQVDKLEQCVLPTVGNIQESKNAGYEMIGEKGFSCIACHDFNGQKSGGAGALDLVNTTTRLQKNWFHLYMRSPQRFHPGIIMPSYWPGGQSLRPDVLSGDAAQQIEALWTYLEGGTRAKNPIGLSRQSKEIRVTDVAEMARGRSSIGYRGVAVGYPGRISLGFDSEEMSLRQLWKGEFANVDLGSFQPRALDSMVAFPAGVPFHRLKSLDDAWPAKGKTTYGFPQNLGYQFRGYELDAQRRPTFHYEYGEVKVDDFFEDETTKNGQTFFRRTIRFTAPANTVPFFFRAACGTKVVASGLQAYQADKLTVRVLGTQSGQVREGELLLPLNLPAGTSTLILEYQW
jgi:mono/diheme cytochrome c family protein